MKLTFLGTRANIEARSRLHGRHSALLLTCAQQRIMVDCGQDWERRVHAVAPDGIILTHAHPDHAWGLAGDVRCPVYATADAWEGLTRFEVADRRVMEPRSPLRIGRLEFEVFPVIHSLRAPAVGLRISGDGSSLFYVPDVVDIEDRAAALAGIDLFVGDGATLTRPLVRRRDGNLFGHTTVRAQLGWCAKAGVRRALFTHCGTEVVTADGRTMAARIRAMGRKSGVVATFAHDGLEVTLPCAPLLPDSAARP